MRYCLCTCVIFLCVLCPLSPFSALVPIVEASDFSLYANTRFGYEVLVPAAFLPQEAPTNNDGRQFLAPDGKGSLAVFAFYNALEMTPSTLLQERMAELRSEGVEITYKAAKDFWFVLSGIDGGEIFYEKVLFSRDGETILTLLVRYPAVQKDGYERIVTQASRSLAFR
ncbi:hypothetical protein [Aminiphilus circumscriptus]|uniref:hypothetical protein n=1 Tax=Aminiphilus circumscriptus TaxID=290732 RepID=UPI0004922492|nr:hypothetical protein [Aminiphilus circumscriptus]